MKVLVVGLGSIATKHIKALRDIEPGVNIFALRSDVNNIQEEITNVEWKDLHNHQFTFAIISNPTILHEETILKLADHKIPLLIEKPVLSSLRNSATIISTLQEKNIITYTAYNLRFLGCLEFVKNYLTSRNPRVNEVNVYCGSYLPDWRPGKNFREIYSANQSMGGGVHLDLSHEVDYSIWLWGNPAHVENRYSSKSSLNIDAVDYANMRLDYDDFTLQIQLNYFRKDAKRQMEIVMEETTWLVDLVKNSVMDLVSGELLYASNECVQATYTAQLKYFLNCLSSKSIPMNGIEESLNTLKICLHGIEE